ncbi:carbohydrate sulfotransferase 11-like [Eriocheir sinensis]|uniref:carbohydrate sulfotransferase 11-like n=1 Tax=Eriocheir sinensis TaxID=95602 RepID=UPI0021C71DA8|nr:carbohydrate sulfotransferase 11-like [Eriocheir sinensis]XP_050716916.1 carbohydrate sulfotransferase 11-like [Eriocheir sinensis]
MLTLVLVRLRSVAVALSPRRMVLASLAMLTGVFFLLLATSSRSSSASHLPMRMQERVERLESVCAGMPAPSEVAAAAMAEATRLRTQVLEEHRLMVCVVFKAGSTTWNSIVAHRYNNTEILKTRKFYKLIEMLKATRERFQEVSRSSLFLRAVMARHPLERLLSAYKDRIEDQSHVSSQARYYSPLILRHTRGHSYSREDLYNINGTLRVVPTFREFVSYLVSRPPEEYDPHWRPVSLLCGLCHVQYTAVVLTETYNEDMLYVMRASGLGQAVNATLLLKKNNNRGKGDTHQLLNDYYSTLEPPLLQQIINIYQNDFRLFNYAPGDVLRPFITPPTSHAPS